ncbi:MULTISPECIES: hypothetical protein [Alteromonas]|uniref:hypothetical protein n=1 Tax=Alteromonas TaxID=226 RepID=UPI0018CC2A82|nr:hypothetical protein [Pseudomonadota bacterium]
MNRSFLSTGKSRWERHSHIAGGEGDKRLSKRLPTFIYGFTRRSRDVTAKRKQQDGY